MAMLFGTAFLAFFGVVACSVPYLYAYCNQNADSPVEIIQEEEDEKNTEINEDILQVGGEKSNNSVHRKELRTINTDTTSYTELPTIKRMLFDKSTQTLNTEIHLNDTSVSSVGRREPLKVHALVHAEDPNFSTMTLVFSDDGNIFQTPINNINNYDLMKKEQSLRKKKSRITLKKFWPTSSKSKKFPGSSSSEGTRRKSLSTGYLGSISGGIGDNTSSFDRDDSSIRNLESLTPRGNSTLQNPEFDPKFQKVNLSLGHPNVLQAHNKSYLLLLQEIPHNKDIE